MNATGHFALRRHVESYLDGEAESALALRIRRHLTECWLCSERAEWLTLVKRSLRQLDKHRPPELAVFRLHRYARSLIGGS